MNRPFRSLAAIALMGMVAVSAYASPPVDTSGLNADYVTAPDFRAPATPLPDANVNDVTMVTEATAWAADTPASDPYAGSAYIVSVRDVDLNVVVLGREARPGVPAAPLSLVGVELSLKPTLAGLPLESKRQRHEVGASYRS